MIDTMTAAAAPTMTVEETAETAPAAGGVSAVIVSYFTGPLLFRCLARVLADPSVTEVVVVDNGTWSATLARLEQAAACDERLTILSGHGNIGFSAGCNLGAARTTGEFLFILNPDAAIVPGDVGRLLAEGQAHGGGASDDRHWVIGGRLVNMDGTEQAGSRRRTLTPWSALVEMSHLWRFAPKHPYFRRFNSHQEPCPDRTIPVPTISGACMLLPRTDYLAFGGMDEAFFLHAEDVDFCLRFRQGGGEVLFCPHVDVLHAKSSSRANRLRVERRKAQSVCRYFHRHFPDQYPPGFVTFVCAVVWTGFGARVVRGIGARALSLIGLGRRRGVAGTARALRVTGTGGKR